MLPASERPRERLQRCGPLDLPDSDLLAVVLGVGNRHRDATGVARELTSNGGGILGQSWLGWIMSVRDEHGTELFSLTVSDFGNGNSGSKTDRTPARR